MTKTALLGKPSNSPLSTHMHRFQGYEYQESLNLGPTPLSQDEAARGFHVLGSDLRLMFATENPWRLPGYPLIVCVSCGDGIVLEDEARMLGVGQMSVAG